MGGTIELESQLNVGTTFTITIPFEIDASYEEREEEKREISRNPHPAPERRRNHPDFCYDSQCICR